MVFIHLVLLFFVLYVVTNHFLNKVRNLPPSPFPTLPIIGHLHLLKQPLHRSLFNVSNRHGPVLLLQLGQRRVLLVSSPSAAEECFTKNDVILANRPRLLAGKHLGYNFTSLGWAPYSAHWRNLRKIAALEILSSHRLQLLSGIRSDEVRHLLRSLYCNNIDKHDQTTDLKSVLFELTLNVMTRMILGKRYYGDNVEKAKGVRLFREIVTETFRVSGGASSVGDFLPVLGALSRVEKRLMDLQRKKDDFLQDIVEEHRQRRIESGRSSPSAAVESSRTMVEVLLALQESEPEHYKDETIKGLMSALLAAGTDTSAVTMEWAMSLLLNNPEILKKAQEEIDDVVGHDRLITESDMGKIPYLHCIMKETMRMYPAGPLLVPHESSEEFWVSGYRIPRGTMLLVNMWGIHNDPKIWEEPTKFRPERFEGFEGTKDGFRYVPFGSGRRGCPGEGLAMRMVGLSLGSLLQCFEWKRVGKEMVDMTEGPGLTMPKARPLLAKCSPLTNHFLNKIRNLPPSPFPTLPIIGHLHLLKQPLHRSLFKISNRHGPVLLLQLGHRRLLLVSSPSAAEECFTKNDVVFANRPRLLAAKHLGYNFTSVTWAPYGTHWRNIRKLASNEILSSHRVQLLSGLRSDEVRQLLRSLYGSSHRHETTTDLKSAFFELTLNVIMRMMVGKIDYGEEGVRMVREIVTETFRLSSGASSVGDFLPLLGALRGEEKAMMELQRNKDDYFQELIELVRQGRTTESESSSPSAVESGKTMVEIMLKLQESDPEYYTDEAIKSLMSVMLEAGTDTSAVTMEWAMSLLLNNPEILRKAQDEIDDAIGHDRLVTESDMGNLPYLHCIIKETMRMYPVGPLLAPHESSDECVVSGYRIPWGTMLLVNMWGIQNDPQIWEEPTKFRPERFEGFEGSRDGFRFMPFGSGRRSCPGEGLGLRMVSLGLSSLLQCFKWERVGPEMVDMTEGPGLTMPKAQPLFAKCSPRPSMLNLLRQI
ncbi:hypothetical protein Tsubulata_036347 [Turnera subulata]|uniref:Uncharacterized protein n=1 Tax=Turnera subulata TaxID=218843 RepID=A0A9Q0JP21_9ROSI|nr:hypothetical protein Tsubulata_036347 [Turnera subulata]